MATSDTRSLVTVQYLQALVEREKTALARAIHDDLGGMLIATAMDLALLKRRFTNTDAGAIVEIERATRSLTAAVDMMRQVTEELHPTLLDNVGLLSALRWLMKGMCHRTGLVCMDHFPSVEPLLVPDTAITLFRVGQEALVASEHREGVSRIDFFVIFGNSVFTMKVQSNASGEFPKQEGRGFVAMSFLCHRVEALGGSVLLNTFSEEKSEIAIDIPLDLSGSASNHTVRVHQQASMGESTHQGVHPLKIS